MSTPSESTTNRRPGLVGSYALRRGGAWGHVVAELSGGYCLVEVSDAGGELQVLAYADLDEHDVRLFRTSEDARRWQVAEKVKLRGSTR